MFCWSAFIDFLESWGGFHVCFLNCRQNKDNFLKSLVYYPLFDVCPINVHITTLQ